MIGQQMQDKQRKLSSSQVIAVVLLVVRCFGSRSTWEFKSHRWELSVSISIGVGGEGLEVSVAHSQQQEPRRAVILTYRGGCRDI